MKRHNTKSNSSDFGEEELKNWWRDKDFIGKIPEKIIDETICKAKAVSMIFEDVV